MKKSVLIFSFIIGLALILVACTNNVQTAGKTNVSNGISANGWNGTSFGDYVNGSTVLTDSNSGSGVGEFVSTTLKAALGTGNGHLCQVNSASGVVTMKIKGTNYKQEFTEQGVTSNSITKEEGAKECVYTILSSQGRTQCNKSCIEIPAEAKAQADAQKASVVIKCKNADISDS